MNDDRFVIVFAFVFGFAIELFIRLFCDWILFDFSFYLIGFDFVIDFIGALEWILSLICARVFYEVLTETLRESTR